MAKPKYSRFVSPKGEARFCFVNQPSKPFKEGDKEYFKTDLKFPDTPENREWCDKVMEAGIAEGKANKVKMKKAATSPFDYPEDRDDDDYEVEEGKTRPKYEEEDRERIIFTTKSMYKPGLIDSQKNALPEDVKIMGGDTIRVKVELNPYEGFGSGVSLRLKTVQLIEKNTSFDGGSVDDDGFDEEEDGYVAPTGASDEDEDF